MDEKSLSPLFPVGGGTVVTNDWCIMYRSIIEPHCKKTCLMLYANNKDADEPAHLHSLISVFVIHSIASTIPTDYITKTSISLASF